MTMISFKKLFSKNNLAKTIILIVIIAAFIFSLITFLVKQNSHRRTFIFPSVESGNYVVEYRNLGKKPVQGDVNYYIDELLLGSQIERTKMLFTPGTKVLSCFQRDNVLYLNLSPDLLNMGENVVEIKDGMDLLKLNVQKNFKKIQDIQIFVNGKIAYGN